MCKSYGVIKRGSDKQTLERVKEKIQRHRDKSERQRIREKVK